MSARCDYHAYKQTYPRQNISNAHELESQHVLGKRQTPVNKPLGKRRQPVRDASAAWSNSIGR